MQIKLRIAGKEKNFVNDFVSARLLREALKLNEEIAGQRENGKYSVTEQLDKLAEFAVKVFNHQFTLDELWDGMELNKFQDELNKIFTNVLGLGGYVIKEEDSEGK